MSLLELKLAQALPQYVEEARALVCEHGTVKVGSVNIAQAYNGMRGVNALVCDTSEVHPQQGLIIRGKPIGGLLERLPEEIFWLLLTGELPNEEELTDLQIQIQARSHIPPHIWTMLETMPEGSHPMAMLSAALTMMNHDSVFAYRVWNKNYSRFWALMLEDALRLLGRLPMLAAGIYRLRYKKGETIPSNPHLSLADNFAKMLGFGGNPEFAKLLQLYLVIHSDHESGNATAYATLTAASALNDPYLSLAAGMNALAGPLHGLASEECLKFLQRYLHDNPDGGDRAAMESAIRENLAGGHVLHGFGHAVLRVTDPRYAALEAFGTKHFAGDPRLKAAQLMAEVGSKVLAENPRIKSPWPNVDAISGTVLSHYGFTDAGFYTVLFGVGLSIGLLAQLVLSRALNAPLIRPKSVTTNWLKGFVKRQ